MTRNQSLHCTFAFAAITCLLLGTAAAQDDAAEEVDVTGLTKLPVLITDQQGNPVAGAEVSVPLYGRLIDGESDWYGSYWNRDVYGPPKIATSDERGMATGEYPAHVKSGPKIFAMSYISLLVKHTEFVPQYVNFDLGPEQAEVSLTPGCETLVTAVDGETLEPVENFGVSIAGPYFPTLWGDADGGRRRTGSIKDGTWQTMLVKLQDEGPTLFSDVMSLRYRLKQKLLLNNIRLETGAVVRGTLSDNVPRPVKGYIVAASVPKPAEDFNSKTAPSLVWYDWTDVAEDGTFEFESLPRGGELQLIAICEGWISKTSIPDAGHYVMGQLFDVDAATVDVELEMEPTGTLEVEVFAPDGKPLMEGKIGCGIGQRFYKGRQGGLGRRLRSANEIRNQFLPPDQRLELVDRNLPLQFSKPLSKDGITVLTGIPVGGGQKIRLYHDQLKLRAGSNPETPASVESIRFSLSSARPEKLKLNTIE